MDSHQSARAGRAVARAPGVALLLSLALLAPTAQSHAQARPPILTQIPAAAASGPLPTAGAAPPSPTTPAPAQAQASMGPVGSGEAPTNMTAKNPGDSTHGAAAAADEAIPGSLTLADTLRIARERNPLLAAARAEAEAAAADRLTAALRPNPAVTVESSGYPLFAGSRPGFWDGQESTVRLDQEIEIGGRRGLRMRAAEAGAGIARLEARNRARALELQIERAYFTAVLAQTDRGVSDTTLAEIDRVIALNRARFEQGEISGAELRRLQVERLRFVEDLFSAELALKHARAALLALLNAPRLDRAVTLTDALAAPPSETTPSAVAPSAAPPAAATASAALTPAAATPTATPDIDARIAQALQQRPDAQAAQLDRDRAETQTRLQRALRTPNVTVGAGYLRDRRVGSNGNGIIVSATMPLPLFDRNQGGIARADAERRAADARAQAVAADVRLDLQQALDTVATSRARVRYIEREYLTTAREARDIVYESYRVGAADLIDYLDAQRAFRDTLRTYNRALFDERVSLFTLAAAEGRGDLQP